MLTPGPAALHRPAGDAAPPPCPLLWRVLSRLEVALQVDAAGLQGLFDAIAQRIAAPQGPSERQVRERLWQRHRRQAPPVQRGLCLPHAALPALRSHRLLYLRLARPLQGSDGPPVQDALALLIPRPGLAVDHRLLAELQQLFSQPALLACLRAGRSAEAVRAAVAALA